MMLARHAHNRYVIILTMHSRDLTCYVHNLFVIFITEANSRDVGMV